MVLHTSAILRYIVWVCLVLAAICAYMHATVHEPFDPAYKFCDWGPQRHMYGSFGTVFALGAGAFAMLAWALSGRSGRSGGSSRADDEPPDNDRA
jgi:hypothetical protein